LAVLVNPGSGRVRRSPGALERLRALPGAVVGCGTDQAGIASTLRALLGEPCDALCVVGGDGTLQAALTALHAMAPAGGPPPLIALPGGSTNMSAYDLGVRGTLPAAAEAVARWWLGAAGAGRVRRPYLVIERPGHEPVCGLFFGLGVVSGGVRFFRSRLREVATPDERTSLVPIARVVWALARGQGRRMGAGPVSVSCDGGPVLEVAASACMATTLRRLVLGLRPYWGEGEGPVRFTLVEEGARGLWTSLWRLARGRAGRRLTPERGYHSRSVDALRVRFDGTFVVDGELFETHESEGWIDLHASPEVTWLAPG